MLAELLMDLAAAQPSVQALQQIAVWLPSATRRVLSADDLAQIDVYTGSGEALHEMLHAVLPLDRPVWYEANVIAQHGTHMVMGYGATPAGPGQLDIWCAVGAVGASRVIGPLGPLRIDSQSIDVAADASSPDVRELRAAAGIVLRALMMKLGSQADAHAADRDRLLAGKQPSP